MIVRLEEYDEALGLAKKALVAGKLVVYPTDTLYGIGADARSDEAVGKVRKAKGRDGGKPISIVCSGLPMIEEYCEVSGKNRLLMTAMLPGPFTVILPSKGKLAKGLAGKTVGVRVPMHFFLLALVKECGFPITSTSANSSGGKDPCEVGDVPKGVRDSAEIIIDGGKCHHSAPSTVVDLSAGEPKVLRQGAGKMPEGDLDGDVI